MDERTLNHDIAALFRSMGAFAYKIPDPPRVCAASASKRPFDGFAVFPPPVGSVFFESKLMKGKLRAFALRRIEPHQMESLLRVSGNGATAVVSLGFWSPRSEYWLMLFDAPLISALMREGAKSVGAAKLARLRGMGMAIPMRRGRGADPINLDRMIVRSLPMES